MCPPKATISAPRSSTLTIVIILGSADLQCSSPRPFKTLPFPIIAERIVIAMITAPPVFSRVSRTLSVFSAALLFATLVWANDPPWKGKPYQQWDLQDIQSVFTDSPWARMTTIIRNWLPNTGSGLPNDQLAGSARGIPSTMDQSSAAIGGDVGFLVLWASSRVMRAAYARDAILHGRATNLDLEKYVAEPQNEYQVTLQSVDLSPFLRKDEQFYRANAFLEMRKSKQRISPTHVRYDRDAKGVRLNSVVFFFPKKTPSGDPTIPNNEKNVEFICNIEGSILRVGFELQKMVDKDGPAP